MSKAMATRRRVSPGWSWRMASGTRRSPRNLSAIIEGCELVTAGFKAGEAA